MPELVVQILIGVLSVAVLAGGVALAANFREGDDLLAAALDRYASGQGGWVGADAWGRSAAAMRFYGAGIALVGLFGLGIAVRIRLVVVVAFAALVLTLLGATLAGFRFNMKTASVRNPPPRIWEMIGWAMVMLVLFVVGATAEALLNGASGTG